MKSLTQIYFSPTNTTKKILNSIAEGIGYTNVNTCDITLKKSIYNFHKSDLTVIGVPVYGGRIPQVVESRISELNGNNTPIIVVVVYGNREYEDSLLELSDKMKERGFNVISAAAFIGEHSFSSNKFPIAQNRPDSADLVTAFNYGKNIYNTINNKMIKDELIIPGNKPYKKRGSSASISPITNKDKCVECFLCAEVCPTNAINKEDSFQTKAQECILCAACIKACKTEARIFENEGIISTTIKLSNMCKTRKEPKIFI